MRTLNALLSLNALRALNALNALSPLSTNISLLTLRAVSTIRDKRAPTIRVDEPCASITLLNLQRDSQCI